MQNRISYYILSLLHLNGSVRIPGIGRLTQKREAAVPDDLQGSIQPPHLHSSFQNEPDLQPGQLERYIAYKTNESRAAIRKDILRFSRDLEHHATRTDGTDVAFIGTFRKDTGAMDFTPREEFLDPGHTVLPTGNLPSRIKPAESPGIHAETHAISITPVAPEEEDHTGEPGSEFHAIPSETSGPIVPEPALPAEEVIIEAPQEEISQQNPLPVTEKAIAVQPEEEEIKPQGKEKNRRVWLIPVILVLLLSVAGAIFLLTRKGHQDAIAEVPVVETPVVEEQITDTTQPEEPVTTEENPEYNDVNGQEGTIEEPVSDTSGSYTDNTSSVDDQDNSTSQSEETNTTEEVAIPTESTSSDKACTIIVGAFSLTANADRMLQELASMGYPVRSIQKGRLAQVGVPVDCASADLSSTIAALRNAIEPSAWLLSPE